MPLAALAVSIVLHDSQVCHHLDHSDLSKYRSENGQFLFGNNFPSCIFLNPPVYIGINEVGKCNSQTMNR